MLCLSVKPGNYQCSKLTRQTTMFQILRTWVIAKFARTRGGAGTFGCSGEPFWLSTPSAESSGELTETAYIMK